MDKFPMHPHQLSERVQERLSSAGWLPDRAIATGDVVDRLISYGYKMTPGAVAALASLYRLRVKPVRGRGCAYYAETILFEPETHAKSAVGEVREYEDDFCIVLSPLAVIGDDVLLCMDDQGRLFGVGQHLLWFGRTLDEGLRCLLLAEFRPIMDCESIFPVKRRPLTENELRELERQGREDDARG